MTVYDKNRKVLKEVKAPAQITGYEYEIASCLDALDKNATECWEMPHSETLRIMKMMDELRIRKKYLHSLRLWQQRLNRQSLRMWIQNIRSRNIR